MRHILVPTDLSPTAAVAFATAKELQQLFQARVTVALVEPNGRQSEESASRLKEICHEHFAGGQTNTTVLKQDTTIPQALLSYAEEHQVGLIVMASHGRSGIARMLCGSVAENIMHNARCPILIVPQRLQRKRSSHEGVHIVVTTDLSPGSEAALTPAKSLLAAYGSSRATLTMLHVAENMVAATFGNSLGESTGNVRAETERDAETALRELHGEYFAGTLAMTSVIRGMGKVDEEIITFADSRDADYIIIASHGHSALEQVLLGSIAQKVARTAQRRVLIIPRNGHDRRHLSFFAAEA